ncbi:SprT-like domain-containing protein [Halarchaeum sp. P4]|uniref:SprT-like domain-containing protein n=1 Tax=Halarchaeum sp. P4 TaxID=3421639 RepID=UPI003EB7EAF8
MEFDSDAALRGWLRHEVRAAAERDLVALDPALVDVAVSAHAKRRAGACRHVPLPDGAVGTRPDWDAVDDRHREATLVLARRAADAFDEATLHDVVRHELLHAEQVQAYGVTDHGPAFRERAAALEVPLTCPPFADPAYRLYCARCGDVVGRRYRRCPTVETPENYRTGCCSAALTVEECAPE